MSFHHAVLLIDHHKAEILQFDAEHLQAQKIKSRSQHRLHDHHTRKQGSDVRTDHEFFGEVCDALAGIAEVLVAGGHTSQTDFRHYVEKHRPQVAKQIVAWDTVDHPTDGELVALARKHFAKVDRMAGTAPLT
jgi:stalled ribosome rescue protein Dom34